MRVLGIDCGTEYTGYGVVELLADDRLLCITCGAIKVSAREPMPTRLSRISIRLQELIAEHCPDRVAIEEVFYAVNVKSALKLGHACSSVVMSASFRLRAHPSRTEKILQLSPGGCLLIEAWF